MNNRLTDAQNISSASSLVGSYFHGDENHQWQGCVVAEPHPGIYLVELFSWIAGDSSEQILVRIEDMLKWHFYDDATWMNNVWEHGPKPWRDS